MVPCAPQLDQSNQPVITRSTTARPPHRTNVLISTLAAHMTFLPLSHFIQRSRILSLYRKSLRSAGQHHHLAQHERTQIKHQITAEYRKQQDLTDQQFIRQCLVQAEKQATFLQSGVDALQPQQHHQDDGQDKWDRAGGPDKNDVLGRVGTGWAWDKKN